MRFLPSWRRTNESDHNDGELRTSSRYPMLKLENSNRVSYVIGPQGYVLTLADLPSTSSKRWTVYRKAEVVAAVRGGLLSLDGAYERYSLTVEEFVSWQQPRSVETC